MAIGKTAPNGTLNADGAFYSVQDVNVLLENAGGGGGGELPTPTVADAGSVVVVDNEGKYALGEAGGGGDEIFWGAATVGDAGVTLNKNYNEIMGALDSGMVPIFIINGEFPSYLYFSRASAESNVYEVDLIGIGGSGVMSMQFTADSATGVLTNTFG